MSNDKRNLMSSNGFSRPDQDGHRKGFSYPFNSENFLDSSASNSNRNDFQASSASKSHLNNSISSGQACAKSSSSTESRTVPHSSSHSSSTSHLQIVIALYNYSAKDDGDLSFRKGDRLIILDNGDPDWWLAKHKATNQKGYIPRNYVVSEAIETEEYVCFQS